MLTLLSCRQNIVEPDGFVTNINEPVQINERYSYTFLLNADNLTVDVVNNTRFSFPDARISISIIDHTSGYVRISVSDRDSNRRFSYLGDEEENLFTEALNGYIPNTVAIKTVDFSGKLKIQLNRTF